jgi:hypothetical protein
MGSQVLPWVREGFEGENYWAERTRVWPANLADWLGVPSSDPLLQKSWTYEVDNTFARRFFYQAEKPLASGVGPQPNATLCVDCTEILSFDRRFSLSELRTFAERCGLCKLLLSVLSSLDRGEDIPVRVRRNGSDLEIADNGRRILRLCSSPTTGQFIDEIRGIQLGFPNLHATKYPLIDSSLYFELLRQWLRECKRHSKCRRKADFCPTRLIYVGNSDPNMLKLVEQAGQVYYIALSHCWGDPTTDDKEKFCTTPSNLSRRRNAFTFNDLPKTFQDAIQVTRELRIQYLWIDSLCIIQGEEGNTDWETEAKLMERVFNSAYCTIAATSATSWNDGFLERKATSQAVQVQDVSGRWIYVCDNIDNFDVDVDDGNLNKRGWVLQERVLSRRTIHFTERHTYWECGEGVLCENFTRMKIPFGKQFFVLDPMFPSRLIESGSDRTIDFVQYLFAKYARCDLSVPSDRNIAISGLMKRMEEVLKTSGNYGVLKCFLPRLLLWRRSKNNMAESGFEYYDIPSWSWMRYPAIDFPRVPGLAVPENARLRFSTETKALWAEIRPFQKCKVKKNGGEYTILVDQPWTEGKWWLDKEFDLDSETGVVVVGLEEHQYRDLDNTCWVLATQRLSENRYVRVGLGKIKARYISRKFREGMVL